MVTQLKPTEWLGYSADTDDDRARWAAARRLGCSPQELEVVRDRGAVRVRRKRDDDNYQRSHS